MSATVLPETLKALTFFGPATDAELQQFAAAARRAEFAPGSAVFREGDRQTDIFIITDGTVALEISGPGHRPKRIQTVGSGELLGWSPLLGGAAMTATARAVTPVRAVTLDAQAVLAVCDADPRFGYALMRRVAAAVAGRLNATRLQLLDVYGDELPEGLGVLP